MRLDTTGLPVEMIDFLNATIGGTPPETAFQLIRQAGRLNKDRPLVLENEAEVQMAEYTGEDVLAVPKDMMNVDNDPWLILSQIMEWEIGMELPTLHQLCFAAGTLRQRTRHTQWELDVVDDFRGMPQHLLGWYDRANETDHPHAYRLACWMVLDSIVYLTEQEAETMSEPWESVMVDLKGLRLILSRLNELKRLREQLGMQENPHLGYDDIRHRLRRVAKLIWPGFEPEHAIDEDGNPLDDDGNLIEILTGRVLPKRKMPPEMDIEEVLDGLILSPEYEQFRNA